jgi:hypothetical protein
MSRHSIIALATGVALSLGFATASFAAGEDFCRDYARAALNQVRGAWHHHECREQMSGARWSTDWHTHYDWCRSVSRDQAWSERNARREMLEDCAR